MAVSRLWLLATLPVLAAAVVAIIKLAAGIAKNTREAVIASLPVVPRQRIVLPATGRYAIAVQGKVAERGLRDLRFSVIDEGSDTERRVAPTYARSTSASLDGTVRLELYSFDANAGPHSLLTLGIEPARDYAHNRVLVARQGRGALALRIVAVVLSGLAAIGALVATLLLLAGGS